MSQYYTCSNIRQKATIKFLIDKTTMGCIYSPVDYILYINSKVHTTPMPKLKQSPTQDVIHEYDRAIGAKIHDLRIAKGMTQQEMSALLDVTYQQAHKYEKGINRISAGRLALLARQLDVPISYFFDGIDGLRRTGHEPDRLHMETARNFRHISNVRVREAVGQLIRSLSDNE